MNRTKQLGLSMLAFLCCIAVTAQTAVVTKCEYWIDQQIDSRAMASMTTGELSMQLDLSALPVGLHSITLRTGTDDGRWGNPIVKNFIVPQPGSTQENNLAGYEYWVDGDYNNKVSGTFSAGGVVATDLDMGTLPAGLHSLSFRALDDNGHVSSVLVKYFIVPQPGSTQENNLAGYEYWVDGDYSNKVLGTFGAGGIVATDLDMSALPVGLHSLSFRALDDNGHVSSVLVKYFIVPQPGSTQENTLTGYEYWIDGDMDSRVSGTFSAGSVVTTDLDMSALPVGLHSLSFRALDDNGHVSSALVKYFLVPQQTSSTENGLISYRYWIDKDVTNAVEATIDASGIVDLNIELETLQPGLHSISYQVKDQLDLYSPALVSYFIVPEDTEGEVVGDKIVAYEYWFKDNPRKRVEVEPTAVLTIDNTQLLLEGVEPEAVLADYVFDVTTKNVVYTQDVNFGLQVFNNLGTGSAAVTQTIEGYQTFMDTQMQTLVHETVSTLAAPTGCKVQGYQYNCNVGNKLYWFMDLTEGTTVDFYNGDGTKIDAASIGVETIGDKQARTITATTATVYALVYGAIVDEGQNTIKVAQPVTITINNAERKYGAENPTFTYTSEQQSYIIGTPTFVTDADENSAVGEYTITLNQESIGNTIVIVNNGTLTITKADGYISYEETIIDKNDTDEAFTNELTLTGDGTVTYSSDNINVATVDVETGEVTITGIGETTITATVVDGVNYTYTTKTARYTLKVTEDPTGIHVVRTNDADDDGSDAWYTLSGQRLSTKPHKQGVYVRNGRKVMVK